ncbi:hypothetical protein [Kitasatospora aureofaciens]|uniref:hypothetical protein n=1 Tax=Kitasatospora aureofaciens TaxID=1894 RepID=UPI001C4531B8|nr:hypothetical protein [Kitasatospora aureofaciens]MBV6697577.1 hypothetical protein [Kitasatospora aureofaciens]
MDKRNALRAGAVSATVTLMMLLSSPAMALTRDDGDDPGAGLSVGQTIGLYVLIPIVAFAIIAALAGLPYGNKGKKK